jgi:UDP-3-O-[3-hydroxymyristoyl] N-acetylglucosamine deacetylase
LDLLGDLALLGHRILGRVIADRAGHAMHTAMVSLLLKDHSLWQATTMDDLANGTHADTSKEISATR